MRIALFKSKGKTFLVTLALSLCTTLSPLSSNSMISPAHAAQVNTTYSYTGSYETFTVPSGVTSLTWTVTGGSGGSNYGGKGFKVVATSTVTPGTNYFIYVGGQGYLNSDTRSILNAFVGGGKLGSQTYLSASGGGASDVRIGGTALANRMIVAGGGGGGGSSLSSGGGNAGYATGDIGLPSANGGGGGTQSAGGTAGNPSGGYPSATGFAGSLGQGADARAFDTGSAGGGGYYGGGSAGENGTGAGGGGGSSYVNATYATYVSGSSGVAAALGNGSIQISYTMQTIAVISVSFDTGVTLGTFRNISRLKAISDSDGKVTFTQNGKRIASCIRVPTTSGIAYCSWKPSNRGASLITATVYPTDPSVTSATSPTYSVVITNRATTR